MRTPAIDDAAFRAAVRGRMPALDGLRGIAVLVIVWHNVAGVGGAVGRTLAGKIYFAAANAGWIAVTLFFALSGFLITGILLDSRGRPRAWFNFSARRALRIFPLYYVALAVAFIVLPFFDVLPAWLVKDRTDQVWYWTYLLNWVQPFGIGGPGFGHFWSLAVEEQFYLIWPLFALSLGMRRLAAFCSGLILVAFAARIAILSSSWPGTVAASAVYSFSVCRWDALAFGAMVAIAARDEQWAPRLLRLAWPVTLVLLGSALAVGAWRHGFVREDWAVAIVGQPILAALCAGLVALAVSPGMGAPSWYYQLLDHPALRAVGKYSYAIYVIHFPLMHVVAPWLPPHVVKAGGMESVVMFSAVSIAVFALSYAAAMVSWRYLEGPMLSLRRYLH